MPRTSCLEQPKNDRFFVVRGHRMKTFRGNEAICKVIAFFDWRTTAAISREYGEYEDVPEDATPWIECSIPEIALDLLNTLSKPTIIDCLAVMESINAIEKKETPGKKNQYRLNVPLLNQWCRERHVLPEGFDTRQKFDGSEKSDQSKILRVPVKNFTGDPSKILRVEDVYIGRGVSSMSSEGEYPLPPAEKTEKLLTPDGPPESTAPQSTLYDLQLDEEVISFVKNAYRQSRGAKLTNGDAKRWAEKIQEAEASSSPEEFRTALWRYLGTVSLYLRENKWPIGVFLKEPYRYTDPIPAYRPRQAQSEETPGTRTSSEEPGARLTEASVSKNTPVYLQYVDEWDTLIPDVPCGLLPSFVLTQVKKAIENPEFREVWHEVLNKCALIAANRPDVGVSFKWLFTSTQAGPQWAQIYMGKMDWATRPKGGKVDPFEQALAAARLEEERNNG